MFKKQPKENPETRSRTRLRPDVVPPRNAAVFSYHANRNADLEYRARTALPEENKSQRKRYHWWTAWFRNLGQRQVLLIFGGIIVFMLVVGLNSTPRVVFVGADSTSDRIFLQNSKVYEQAAHQRFASSFANKNKLTVNTSAIADQLEQQFPELRTVSISLPVIGRQAVIYVQPAQPQLILATESGDNFAVDSTGRALAKITGQTKLPSSVKIPTITDQSGIQLKLGSIALPNDSVSFISQVYGQLQAKSVATGKWTLSNGASELDVQVSGTPYFVKFNLRGDAREETGTFLAVKQSLDARKVVPGQYVDVRVTGRAYYK